MKANNNIVRFDSPSLSKKVLKMNVGDCVDWLYCPEMRTHSKTLGLYILWELLFANICAGMKLASCFGNIRRPWIRVETVCESHRTLSGPDLL